VTTHSPTHRRLCGALGVALLLLVGAAVSLAGTALIRVPATATQVALLGVAGLLDLVAAFENPVTTRVDWFRLGGVANVALGATLPVGVLGWGGGAEGALLLVVMAVGRCSIAAVGIDLAAYAGSHVYERPLGGRESE